MNYETITPENFKDIDFFFGECPKYYNRKYGYHRDEDIIIFNANFVCCPCIYWKKDGNKWAFSFDADNVVNYCKENNIYLTDTYDNLNQLNDNIKKHIKSSITKRYKYNLNYIENWKKVILYSDGTFEVIKNDFIPFQLEIKDNYKKFKSFLLKYKNIINQLIDDKLFLPTITGGLDTRGFTWFYRDRVSELDGYFLTAVKQDGKNHNVQGSLEMRIAEQVAKKIGLNLNRYEALEETPYATLSGFFNENAELYEDPLDPDYIYKIVQHGYDNSHQYINKLTIFMDDDYLQFKPTLIFKYLMLLITKDLILIPFVGGSSLFRHYKEGAPAYPINDRGIEYVEGVLKSWDVACPIPSEFYTDFKL